jgi:hypothetical protein
VRQIGSTPKASRGVDADHLLCHRWRSALKETEAALRTSSARRSSRLSSAAKRALPPWWCRAGRRRSRPGGPSCGATRGRCRVGGRRGPRSARPRSAPLAHAAQAGTSCGRDVGMACTRLHSSDRGFPGSRGGSEHPQAGLVPGPDQVPQRLNFVVQGGVLLGELGSRRAGTPRPRRWLPPRRHVPSSSAYALALAAAGHGRVDDWRPGMDVVDEVSPLITR